MKKLAIGLLVVIELVAISILAFAIWQTAQTPSDLSSQNGSANNTSEPPARPNNNENGDKNQQEGVMLTQEEYEQFKQMAEMTLNGEAGMGKPSLRPEATNPAQTEPTNEPANAEPPKAVVIQDIDNMRRHDPKVCENAYDAMAGDAVWLGQEGAFSLMLFGDVSEVYVADNSTNYTNYAQVTINAVTNTAEPYYALSYACKQNQRLLFRVVMNGGTEYFLSVQKV